MNQPRISIIAAIGRNRELGKAGSLIWRIPEDLKRVKELTMGHPLIMGRKTYESIGKPLPGRTNIVVSRTADAIEGCIVASTFEEALAIAREKDQEEIFIFGGASIYETALPITDRLYLTLIDQEDRDADTFFPEYSHLFPTMIETKDHEGDIPYKTVVLER